GQNQDHRPESKQTIGANNPHVIEQQHYADKHKNTAGGKRLRKRSCRNRPHYRPSSLAEASSALLLASSMFALRTMPSPTAITSTGQQHHTTSRIPAARTPALPPKDGHHALHQRRPPGRIPQRRRSRRRPNLSRLLDQHPRFAQEHQRACPQQRPP